MSSVHWQDSSKTPSITAWDDAGGEDVAGADLPFSKFLKILPITSRKSQFDASLYLILP